MGFAMREMSFCPLALKGASASVKSAPNGFELTVTGAGDAAAEVRKRAMALK